jgi:hypothetical protein
LTILAIPVESAEIRSGKAKKKMKEKMGRFFISILL